MEDRELLLEYAERQSERAFAELVSRHLDLVYSTALRVTGEPQLAKDVAQTIFIELARKPKSIRNPAALTGWLYRAARLAAASAVRTEHRRRHRENLAMDLNQADAESSAAWQAVAPHLEEAMGALDDADQTAIVLRFFKGQSLRDVGQALGITEDTAQKRVSRALERLHAHFVERGVTVASGTLAALLAAHAVEGAPAGLALSLAGASLAAGTAAGASGLLSTFTNTLLMTKTTAALLIVLVVGAILTPLLFKSRRAPEPLPAPTPTNPRPAANAPESPEPTVRNDPHPSTPTTPEPQEKLLWRAASLPPLTPSQIENYIEQNKRNAESLLAAYRIGTNAAHLAEAATRFPTDPDVQYAVIAAKAFPEVQRQWIDAYKASSPDNALAWYFSALDHFNTGQSNLAVQDLAEATRKPAFRAELAPTLQAVEKLNISAGRAADEAKVAAFHACSQVPHLGPIRELARAMQTTAQQYLQQGDAASVESLAGMGLKLGAHLSAGGGSQTLINQLVGISIEKAFLSHLDAQGKDPFGRPVAEVRATIEEHHATLKSLVQSMGSLAPTLSDAELANYMEDVKLHGEEAALTWLKAKHGLP